MRMGTVDQQKMSDASARNCSLSVLSRAGLLGVSWESWEALAVDDCPIGAEIFVVREPSITAGGVPAELSLKPAPLNFGERSVLTDESSSLATGGGRENV
jgi:hypothetical protein